MKAQDLKNSVLQLAIQGKLVEQNSNDESASILLEKIKAKKEELIREKRIKKEKYNYEISKEDGLPVGWSYVKIGDISSVVTKQTGFDYSKHIKPNLETQKNDNNLPMIQTKNFKGYSFNFDTDYYLPKDIAIKFPKIMLEEKCLLLSIVGASIGNIGVYEYDKRCILGGAICKVNLLEDKLYDYIYYFLQSDEGQKEIKKNYKSTAQGTITVQDVREIIVPLPPLEEQKRIVAKIEEVLEKIEEYDKAEKELSELEKAFPQDMKKSILQYAIQGKLVEQNPNDEPASVLLERIKSEKEQLIKEKKIKKEKLLPEISEEEKPFEIPDSWEWVRVGEVLELLTDYHANGSYKILKDNVKLLDKEDYAIMIRITNLGDKPKEEYKYISKHSYEFLSKSKLYENDIVMSKITDPGTVYIVPKMNKPMSLAMNLFLLRAKNIDSKYLYYYLKIRENYIKSFQGGTSTKTITKDAVKQLVLALPPLEEQKRIVEKIEKLLNYVDKLQNRIDNKNLINKIVKAKSIELSESKELVNN